LYVLRLNLALLKIDRHEFVEQLRRKGVGASVHFLPVPLHPFFAKLPLAERPCRRALNLYPRIVSLPLYPAMTEEQVRYVVACVTEIVVSNRVRMRTRLTEAS
jgi:dTDP-4-amino-4,6-dideoxygalactose transaminase